MNLKLWIVMLLSYLRPAEDDVLMDDDAPPDDDLSTDDDAPDLNTNADDAPPDDDEPPAPQLSRGQRAIVEARARAQAAEAERDRLTAELAAARRAPVSQAPTEEQVLWQQEEAALRHADTSEEVRYAINAQRNARAAQQSVQQVRFESMDMRDKTQFEQIATKKPELYKKYAPLVEQEIVRMRQQGQNAPREAVMALLIGRDSLNGALNPARSSNTRGATTTGAQARPRSDVSARAGTRLSPVEAAKRRLDRHTAGR